jgi:glycosyltransferase involved in cell wall biosynthesis
MIDIINAYAESGYSCVLITGRLVVRNKPLHESVKIDWIIRYNRTKTFKRLLTWGIGTIQILVKILFKFNKDLLFIVTNPPFGPLIPLIVKNPYRLLIFDIYPDVISELGYLSENSRIIKWWRKSNKKVFSKAERIFTITESMKQVLLKYAGHHEVEVVPIWTDNTFLKPVDPIENTFLKTHNLSGKFIVMFSGNIGLSGGVDVLIDLAVKIKSNDIFFLIIGDGANKEMMNEKAIKLRLKNLLFFPWQPVTELPFSLSSASLAFIFLGAKTSKLVIPSKLFNFLSVGSPLLCVSPKGSEVEKLVTKYECGKNFEQDDIVEMAKFITDVSTNKELLTLMKKNSLKASENFSESNIGRFLTAIDHDL